MSDLSVQRALREVARAGLTDELTRELCPMTYVVTVDRSSLSYVDRAFLSLEEAYLWVEGFVLHRDISFRIEAFLLTDGPPPGAWRVMMGTSDEIQGAKFREEDHPLAMPNRHVGFGRTAEEGKHAVLRFRLHETRMWEKRDSRRRERRERESRPQGQRQRRQEQPLADRLIRDANALSGPT